MKTAGTSSHSRRPTPDRGPRPRFFIADRCVLLLLLALAACRPEHPAPSTTDDLGRPVALPAQVKRVITLAPNLTEMVFAIDEGARVVGTDQSSDDPPAARALPKVGGMQPNIERIVALHPDVVLASTEGNHPSLAPALSAAGIPLFVIRTDRLAEIPRAMRRLGQLFASPRSGNAASQLERAIAAQHRTRTRPPRILFTVWTDPMYVAGRETFTGDILELCGATNAVEVTGWPQYSLESLAAAPPDLIVYPRGAVTQEQMDALLARVPGIRPRVAAVDEDIFQRPGPRIPEAAKALNAILDDFAH